MKILQIVHSLPFYTQGGTEIYTYDLSLELSKRHEVYIFCRTSDAKQQNYEITKKNYNQIAVYSINNTLKDCNSFEMLYENEEIDRKFDELLDEIKPDLVHIQHLVFLSVGIIGKIKKRGIPIVFTLHDYWLMCPQWHIFRNDNKPCEQARDGKFNQECIDCLGEILNIKKWAVRLYILSKQLLPKFIINSLKETYILCSKRILCNGDGINKLKDRSLKVRECLSAVDLFLAPSDYLRDNFMGWGISPEKIKLFRLNLNNRLFIDSQKSKADKIRFAFIGTMLPAKGVHILINAFNRIDSKDAELKIYGKLRTYAGFEYYLPYLKKNIKNMNIRLMEEFNHKDIADIFREIDVLIVPSLWYENSPLVIQEAFLSQTPVIASRIGGIPELVKHNVNGLLFNPGDVKELKEELEYIINNPDILGKFRENIIEVKNTEDKTEETEEIYSGLLTESKALL